MRFVLRVLYWIVTIPYALIIAFFAIGIPYCAVAFIQGGLPRVKSWLTTAKSDSETAVPIKFL